MNHWIIYSGYAIALGLILYPLGCLCIRLTRYIIKHYLRKTRKHKQYVSPELRAKWDKAVSDYNWALKKHDLVDEESTDFTYDEIEVTKQQLNNLICLIKKKNGFPVHTYSIDSDRIDLLEKE